MTFIFTPKSDEELLAMKNENLLPEGIYDFTVRHVKQEPSKAGNDMLKATLVFKHPTAGDNRIVNDFLMCEGKMMFKLKHFCDTIGMSEDYNKGNIGPVKCFNRQGKAIVGIQKGNAKPDGTGNWPDKNFIKDYVKQEKNDKTVANENFLNDAIPF